MRRNAFIIFLTILFHEVANAKSTSGINQTNSVGVILFTLVILIAIVFVLYRRQKRRFND